MEKIAAHKKTVYWYIGIILLVFGTLLLSFSSWIIQAWAAPENRVFSGIFWWSADYFTYLSYVELGRRGELGARLLMTTMEQKPVYTHLANTISGLIFGKLLSLNSVVSYHIARALWGALFLFSTVFFFYRFSRSTLITYSAFVFSFYIASPVNTLQWFSVPVSPYTDFLPGIDLFTRSVGPIHFTAGYIFFLITVCLFFFRPYALPVRALLLGALCNLVLLANPFSYIILSGAFCVYLVVGLVSVKDKRVFFLHDILVTAVGFFLSLPLFLYFQRFLSVAPWGEIGNASGYYRVFHPPILVQDVIVVYAPLLLCGLVGMIAVVTKKIPTPLTHRQSLFLISWSTVHGFLLFFGDRIHIDPIRSNHGLYYLPLSLFAAYGIRYFSHRLSAFIRISHQVTLCIVLFLVFLLTLPNFISLYRNRLFAFTDFKRFSILSYPEKEQLEAFAWLEKNTPVASGVMSMYEAGELIQGFSGNSTEEGLPQETRVRFFSNEMPPDEAYRFLKENNFAYVYMGYQESYYGGQVTTLPFLTKVFENEKVEIYQVI